MKAILGISAYYHDSAAALVVDGSIVAAAQEERFTRVKHDHRFPKNAVDYCLSEAGLGPGDIDHVVFYEKPFLKFERLLETYLAVAPAGFRSFFMAMPLWVHEKLRLPEQMGRGLDDAYKGRYMFPEHHESHAASAFFPSPFEEAAILTLDGVGEWATATLGPWKGKPDRPQPRDAVPPLTGAPLLGLHVFLRVQGEQRRIQAHGPGALRRAPVRGGHPRKSWST